MLHQLITSNAGAATQPSNLSHFDIFKSIPALSL